MVIRNTRIFTNDPERILIDDGTVAFREGVFTFVGKSCDFESSGDSEVIDCCGEFLMPSLVNAHLSLHSTVTSHTLIAAEESPLGTAYYESVVRLLSDGAHAKLSLLSTIAGVLRSLRYGVTTIFGPVFHSENLDPELYRYLANKVGVNLSIGPVVTCKNLETVLDIWQEVMSDDLFCPQLYIADAALYSEDQLNMLRQLASSDLRVSFLIFDMHEESEGCLARWGETLTERLMRNSLLSSNSGIAYAGSLSETDMDLLSSRGVFVSKSVRSELYGGIFSPTIADLLGRGMQVNVGSGFVDVDIFAELKTIMLTDRHFRHFGNKMIDYEIKKTLLEGNYKLANRCFGKKTGMIKEGYSADMVLGKPFVEIDTFDDKLPVALQLILRLPTEVIFRKVWNNGKLVFEDDCPVGLTQEEMRQIIDKADP